MNKIIVICVFLSFGLLGCGIGLAQKKSKSPASLPASLPSSRPVARPASRPTSRPASRPTFRPTSAKITLPGRVGVLSIAMPIGNDIWINGLYAGQAPIIYLRVAAGTVSLKINNKYYGNTETQVKVYPFRHTAVMRRGRRIGFRFLKDEESDAFVYIYPSNGRKLQHFSKPPGPFCIVPTLCPFLAPGEKLYIRDRQRFMIVASLQGKKAALSYPPFPGCGYLTLYSFPPGVLFLNGKIISRVPIARLPLKPGTYRMKAYNGYVGVQKEKKITITKGKDLRLVEVLMPKGGGAIQIWNKNLAQIFIDGKFRGWTPLLVSPLPAGKHTFELRRPGGKRLKKHFYLPKGKLIQKYLRF